MNTSSKFRNCPLVSRSATLIVLNAVSILLASTISPSTSPISAGSFFNSWKRAITVFIAVPAVSADSRVVSIICDKKAAVVSNSIFAESAIDAVFVIAVAISLVSAAVIAASCE